jgi:hypothetical protein
MCNRFGAAPLPRTSRPAVLNDPPVGSRRSIPALRLRRHRGQLRRCGPGGTAGNPPPAPRRAADQRRRVGVPDQLEAGDLLGAVGDPITPDVALLCSWVSDRSRTRLRAPCSTLRTRSRSLRVRVASQRVGQFPAFRKRLFKGHNQSRSWASGGTGIFIRKRPISCRSLTLTPVDSGPNCAREARAPTKRTQSRAGGEASDCRSN